MNYKKVIEGHLLSARSAKELAILEELAGIKEISTDVSQVETFELSMDTIAQALYSQTRGSYNSDLELYEQLVEKLGGFDIDIDHYFKNNKK